MRIIPTQVHGILDYVVGALLIVAPWLFGFAAGGAETWLPVILGAGEILYSLVTDYELGIARALSMSGHLGLDLAAGLLLAVSPWLFGFAGAVWGPHLVIGAAIVLVSLMTERVPAHHRSETHGRESHG